MKSLLLIGFVLVAASIASAPAQTHQAYILCETKTGDPYQWFFSSIFRAGPEVRQGTLENAFTRYVQRKYRDTEHAIGPADCFVDRSLEAAEDHHASSQKWAIEHGNSVVETDWTYSPE